MISQVIYRNTFVISIDEFLLTGILKYNIYALLNIKFKCSIYYIIMLLYQNEVKITSFKSNIKRNYYLSVISIINFKF